MARPAVVNQVERSPLQEVISLRGKWEFATDPHAAGRETGWMRPGTAWPGQRTIEVPACWEAQGVGVPGMSETWDCKWDAGLFPLRNVYMGSAWYRRAVSIPAAWQGKRIWLKIGGVRAQGWFWVNGKPVAHDYTYCGVYKYDITDCVSPGQDAVVVVLVRNDLPSRKGNTSWRHRAGGLYRDVEIEATPVTWIDNARVAGDFDKREAVVHATVAYAAGAGRLKSPVLRVKIQSAIGNQQSATGKVVVTFADGKQTSEVVCRVPLKPFNAWSPGQPNLYVAEITLCDGDAPAHVWTERFGVRKLEVRGDRFFLNNKPFFIRGFGDDHIYPITLVSPASRGEHLKHLKIARAAGFNYVRLHTHCEVPEFFEAADEAGILIQPELPYYGKSVTEAFPYNPKGDLTELITHYQRYVSLATCSMGNEGDLGSPLDRELYETVKKLAPQLLALHQDGGKNTRENSDFRTGPLRPWPLGSFACDAPYITHEYLNLAVNSDPRLEPLFSGAYDAPRDLKSYEAALQRLGLSRAWGDACIGAAHALQRCYQKQGIESARFDPTCDGYSFWTIVDVLFRAQGLFDPFWKPKPGGFTPEEFRLFNGPTAVLKRADGQPFVAVAGQPLKESFWVSHFGEEDLKDTKLVWTLRVGKETLASGSLETGAVVVGAVREIAPWSFTVPPLARPVHAVLEAKLLGTETSVTNWWDFWLFPRRGPKDGSGMAATRSVYPALALRFPGLARVGTPEGDAAQVLIASENDPEALASLSAGRRVVLLDRCNAPDNVQLGWWLLGNQMGTAMTRHPVFGDFPHDGTLSPLWSRIVKRPELLQPGNGFCGAEPLMVGEGIDGYSLYLCQARVGKGRLIRACGLDVLTDTPEGTYLLDAILGYARSEAFSPEAALDEERLGARWKRHQQIFCGLNGWARTLEADGLRPGQHFFGVAKSRVMSLPTGKKKLVWETLPVSAAETGATVTFRWLQVTDMSVWNTKVTAQIKVFLDETALLTYTADILRKEWTVREGDAVLTFSGLDFTQNSITGVMELTVPRSRVRPGRPGLIRLVAEHPSEGQLSTGVIEVNTATFQPAADPHEMDSVMVKDLLQRVSADRIRHDLFYLCRNPLPFRKVNYTRPGQSMHSLAEADAFIRGQLESSGYAVTSTTYQVQPYRCDRTKPLHHWYSKPEPTDPAFEAANLEVTRCGRKHPGEIIQLISHKDSMSWIDSSGAHDNAVGTVANLEMARVLAMCDLQRSVRILFCNEEHVPWTSRFAAEAAAARGDRIIAVLNVDGLDGKSDEDRAAGKMTHAIGYSTDEGRHLGELMAACNTRHSIGLDVKVFLSTM